MEPLQELGKGLTMAKVTDDEKKRLAKQLANHFSGLNLATTAMSAQGVSVMPDLDGMSQPDLDALYRRLGGKVVT